MAPNKKSRHDNFPESSMNSTGSWQADSGKALHRRQGVSPAQRESEVRYCAIFESSLDAIMTLDPPLWRFKSANLAAVKMFLARDVAEFIANEPWSLSPDKQPDGRVSAHKAREMIEIALCDGSHFFEWTHKRLNGDDFPATVLLTRMEISGKKFLQATVHDTTRRKQIEENLKQASARLALATRAGGVGVWDYDIVNNILLWDDQMYALYGIERKDFGGVYDAWRTGVYPEDMERGDAEIQMAIRGEKEFDTEFRVRWQDGSIHNIRAIAVVQRNDAGEPQRMIGTNWDITSLRQAEKEKLDESENRYRSIFQGSTDGIMIADAEDQMILFANSAQCQMFGYSEEELKTMNIAGMHPEETYFSTLAGFDRLVRGEKTLIENVQCLKKNGEIFYADISSNYFAITNRKCVVTFYRDITERNEMQEKLLISEKLAVMGRLVADVAHELNNPLAIIIGRTQLILHRIGEQPLHLKGQLETVLQSARRCKTILGNLLTYSSAIGKKKNAVNLPDLMREAIDAVNYQYSMSEIQVELNCNLPANAEVIGNRVALLSVFVNLIRNARQAMGEKGKLNINIEKKTHDQLSIEIQDNGFGISKEQFKKLFQPFISGWDADEGTGLGLATSLGMIEAYGGKIFAESEGIGKGAKFTILLPFTIKAE